MGTTGDQENVDQRSVFMFSEESKPTGSAQAYVSSSSSSSRPSNKPQVDSSQLGGSKLPPWIEDPSDSDSTGTDSDTRSNCSEDRFSD